MRVFRTTVDGFFMLLLLYGLVRAPPCLFLLPLSLQGITVWSTLLFFAEQTSNGQRFDARTETWIRETGVASPFQNIFGIALI